MQATQVSTFPLLKLILKFRIGKFAVTGLMGKYYPCILALLERCLSSSQAGSILSGIGANLSWVVRQQLWRN
jgi:hypothetical protein